MADIAKPATEAGTPTKEEAAKPVVAEASARTPTAIVPPAEPAKVEAVKVDAAKVEVKAKPSPAKTATAEPAPTKAPASKVAAAKPVAAKPSKTKTVSKPAAPKPASIKETKIMATTNTEITTKIQDAVKDAAAKAKTYAEKSQVGLGEVGAFAKGNVEAMVQSTKILASGMQEMGKGYVAEAKTAFETMTTDAKDLASAKSPTEFFEKQNAILKKNFDAAVAKSSKSSEAMLKLVNEAFQPLSTRMSLAMEKVKKAA